MNWYYNTDTRSYVNNFEVYLDPYFIMITIAILDKFNFNHFNTNPVQWSTLLTRFLDPVVA